MVLWKPPCMVVTHWEAGIAVYTLLTAATPCSDIAGWILAFVDHLIILVLNIFVSMSI